MRFSQQLRAQIRGYPVPPGDQYEQNCKKFHDKILRNSGGLCVMIGVTRQIMNHNIIRENEIMKRTMKAAIIWTAVLAASLTLSGCGQNSSADSGEETTKSIQLIAEGTIGTDTYLDYSALTGAEKGSEETRLSLKGMTRDEVLEKLTSAYTWNLGILHEDDTVTIDDPILPAIEKLLDTIFEKEGGTTDSGTSEDYVLELPDFAATARTAAEEAKAKWDKEAEPGVLTGYDASTGTFIFGDPVSGFTMDAAKTEQALTDAYEKCAFSEPVEAVGEEIAGSGTMESQYKIIGTYTTKTTSNATRNKNIQLASAAVNGTILQPGEEFSFNDRVGERTTEKGYGKAGAYLNGEVVQEVGGGVCQVSTTLYNAVFSAGLTTTLRQSHTFEPSYVTPGRDATVSWGGPNYKFINSSEYPICILESYSNRTVTAQIYGVPVLPEGETIDMECVNRGNHVWDVYKVVTVNGQVTERTLDHTSRYKTHETTTQTQPAETQPATQAAETTAPETTAPETAAPETTAPETTAPAGPASDTVTEAAPQGPGSDPALTGQTGQTGQ